MRTSPFRALAVIGLSLGMAGLGACRGGRTSLGKAPPPEVVLHGVKLRSYRGETLAAWGTAERLVYQRSSGEAEAHDAVLHFTGRGRAPAPRWFVVSAPVMHGNVVDKQALARGGVQLRGENGLSGHTPRARFDGARQIASGRAPVQLKGTSYRVSAGGFTFRLSNEALDFSRPVHTVVSP